MAYCLAKHPDEFGLVPDHAGFVALKHLARALAEEPGWGFLRETHLREVAHEGPFEIAGPFEIEGPSEIAGPLETVGAGGGEAVRSTDPQRLEGFFTPCPEPPEILYFAARRKAYATILEHGLSAPPGSRVVLSASREQALKVGRRRDAEPVMLQVRAAGAAASGVEFTRAGELHYVAEAVPARFLSGPPVEKVPLPRRKPQAAAPEPAAVEMPGSFFPRLTPPPGEVAARPDKRERRNPAWKRDRRRERKQRDEDREG